MKTVSVPWQEEIIFKAFLYCLWIYIYILFILFFFYFFKKHPPEVRWPVIGRALTHFFPHPTTVFHHSTPKIDFLDFFFFQADKKNPVFFFFSPVIQRTRSSAHPPGFPGEAYICAPALLHPACTFPMDAGPVVLLVVPGNTVPTTTSRQWSAVSSRQALSGATPAAIRT